MALVPLKTGVCRSGVCVFGSLKDRCVQVRGSHVDMWRENVFKNGLNKRDGLSSEVPLCSHIVLCLCGQVIVTVLCLCRQEVQVSMCLCSVSVGRRCRCLCVYALSLWAGGAGVYVSMLCLCGQEVQVSMCLCCLCGQEVQVSLCLCSVSVGRRCRCLSMLCLCGQEVQVSMCLCSVSVGRRFRCLCAYALSLWAGGSGVYVSMLCLCGQEVSMCLCSVSVGRRCRCLCVYALSLWAGGAGLCSVSVGRRCRCLCVCALSLWAGGAGDICWLRQCRKSLHLQRAMPYTGSGWDSCAGRGLCHVRPQTLWCECAFLPQPPSKQITVHRQGGWKQMNSSQTWRLKTND